MSFGSAPQKKRVVQPVQKPGVLVPKIAVPKINAGGTGLSDENAALLEEDAISEEEAERLREEKETEETIARVRGMNARKTPPSGFDICTC